MGFIRTLRITAAVLLVLVLAAIARYFWVRSQEEVRVPVKSVEITPQITETKEKVEHFELKGEDENLHVKADRHYVGGDDRYHAEGEVEVIFFKKKDDRDVCLYGNQVVYDKDMNQFVSSGQARVEFKDLVIESILLEYDKKKENFRTEKGVRFSSQRLSGSAREMLYHRKKERLVLQGGVRLKIKKETETSSPLLATGRTLDYNEKSKKGILKGDAELTHGESHSSAEIIRFELYPDGEELKSLVLEQKARASLAGDEGEGRFFESQSSLFVESIKREIQGDEISMGFFPESMELQEVEVRGNSLIKFISSDGSFTQVQAESAKFSFDDEKELAEFQALKKARIVKQTEDPDEMRLIEGDSLTKKKDSDILRVRGRGPYEARMSSRGSDVYAEEMLVSLENSDLEVMGGVKVILSAKPGGRSIGIFSKEEPVLVQAREMRYSTEQKRFLFKSDIRVWQEMKVLRAEEIELLDETGKILCRGGVESTMPHTTKEGKEEKLKVSSEEMTYFPEENLVTYQEKSSLTVKEATLRSRLILVYLNEEDKGIERIVARDEVMIIHELGEARGEEAVFDPDEESLVLLGNPILEDKERGRTEGDKLTFYLTDGRILVENKDRERSITVIKRER